MLVSFVHLAYKVKLEVTFVLKLYNCVKASSKYHPPKLKPSFVGSSGFTTVLPFFTDWAATGSPPFELNVTLYVTLVSPVFPPDVLFPPLEVFPPPDVFPPLDEFPPPVFPPVFPPVLLFPVPEDETVTSYPLWFTFIVLSPSLHSIIFEFASGYWFCKSSSSNSDWRSSVKLSKSVFAIYKDIQDICTSSSADDCPVFSDASFALPIIPELLNAAIVTPAKIIITIIVTTSAISVIPLFFPFFTIHVFSPFC